MLAAASCRRYVNVNRYRNRVAEAISRALGRTYVSHIDLKLLPRPGLVLSNLLWPKTPAMAEPMLRADTVTAYLRLTSLWRGAAGDRTGVGKSPASIC